MAPDGVTKGYGTAANHAVARGNQLDESVYLERFSRLIERGKTVLDVGCGDGLPVDAHLVQQGFAVNGIDVSARLIDLARRNVPEAFYEVRDMLDLREGEYCVDGVVSLRAMLHIPHEHYRALLGTFASFMPRGGALLLSMRPIQEVRAEADGTGATASSQHDDPADNAELIEDASFAVILSDLVGVGGKKQQIILARS